MIAPLVLASVVGDFAANLRKLVAAQPAVKITATRAGALLAGDLRVVMRLVKAEERRVGELTAEAKRGDLLAFTASEGLALLRERMGVAISG